MQRNYTDPALGMPFDKLHVACQPSPIPIPPNHKKGDRLFSTKFYSYTWIEYSVSTQSVFCMYCRHFCDIKAVTAFKTQGFRSWPNACPRLLDHHASKNHQLAQIKWAQYIEVSAQPELSIANRLDSQREKTISNNRAYLKEILRAILYCAKQGKLLCHLVLYEMILS